MNSVTLNLPNELNAKLAYLVQQTGKTADFHFQQALESYLAQTEPQNLQVKREVPIIDVEDRELFGKIYQTSSLLDDSYFYQKLGIK